MNPNLAKYLALLRDQRSTLASNSPGGYEVITDLDVIGEAERLQEGRLAHAGMPMSWAVVGLLYEDQYIMVLRDAVRFPSGELGTYIRVVSKKGGVVILPILADRIALLNRYRHATRTWHLELPRGFADEPIPTTSDAYREVAEEIGANAIDMLPLGIVNPDGGLLATMVMAYVARLERLGGTDSREAVRSIELVTVPELTTLIAEGRITDGYTLAAYALALSKGMLP